MSDRFAGRSVHGAPKHAQRLSEAPVIRVEGAVSRSLEFNSDELATLTQVRFLDAFPEVAQLFWPRTDWSGVPISVLIELASPDPDAAWVQVLGGPFASVFPIDTAGEAILACRLVDAPIPLELGGPFRLIHPAIPYNLCVKWADTIVISRDEPDRSAERIAAARQRARDAKT